MGMKIENFKDIVKMINNRKPEVRRKGAELLSERTCLLETLIKNRKDTPSEYEEFMKCLTRLIEIVYDSKDEQLIETAINTTTSPGLLKALLGYKTEDGRELPQNIRKLVEQRIKKIESKC